MIERGDIYYADLNPVTGSEQGGTRPVLVIQNDTGNRFSPTVIVAAITSNLGKARLPTHIVIEEGALSEKSVVLLEQIRTIDKTRLIKKMGRLSDEDMLRIDEAISVSMGFDKGSPKSRETFWGDNKTK
jgi:mRNA interferase MazF